MHKEFTQQQIKTLIDKHDPALLFDLGAPEDEYVGEAKLVCDFLNQSSNFSKEQITEGLRKIFASRFTSKTVEINQNAYEKLAADIIESMSTEE